MTANRSLPAEDEVREALRAVDDPEVGINIVDLGLVYHVEVGAAGVRVDLTMTSPACPLADFVIEEARRALGDILPEGTDVQIDLVWDPPWSPERMSDVARQALGWSG
ncbi:MAG: metal-sulfur cluster assembly factor [Burkholderiales bacterium]|nr:metal-sulfur cluster assembly factor [Burkholderiales bacterium]